jgi:hypothetical protein
MERGNKPVPQNFEMRDVDKNEIGSVLVPYGGDSRMKEIMRASQDLLKSQEGRQIVYGNLKLGKFDEEISGINLSKMFSVYGP